MSRSMVKFYIQGILNHTSSNSTTASSNLCIFVRIVRQGLTHTPFLSPNVGINTLDIIKKKKAKTTNHAKLIEVGEIIKSLRVAASHADSNFSHKLELLEAENNGVHKNHYEARKSYDAAIKAARKNKFIHEQGLACEKAGLYYKSFSSASEQKKALEYLKQSRDCYEEWGSLVKVEFIERELEKFNND